MSKYISLMLLLTLSSATWAFDHYYCVGSEPFWNLSLLQQKFTFKLQDAPVVNMMAVEPTASENMSIEHIRVYRTKFNNKDAVIIIQKQSCTDGMSEDVFAYEGVFITKDKVYHGCCSKKIMLTHQIS